MREKAESISVYEVFLCMFVILIHLLSEGVAGFDIQTLPSVLFCSVSRLVSFAVPAFIFISGMKLCMKYRETKLDYKSFIMNRIKKIYLPYLIWTVIYYLYLTFRLNNLQFSPTELLKYILSGEISAQLYFILVIMQLYILMPLWLFLCKNFKPGSLILLSALITVAAKILTADFPYTNRMFTSYLVFWIAGCCAGTYGAENFAVLLKQKGTKLYIGWFVFSALHTVLNYLSFCGIISYTHPQPIMILFSCMSILGFYLVIYNMTRRLSPRIKNIFGKTAAASYYIYLIHCLIIFETDFWLTYFGVTSLSLRFILRAAAVYPLSILLCVMYAQVRLLFNKQLTQ